MKKFVLMFLFAAVFAFGQEIFNRSGYMVQIDMEDGLYLGVEVAYEMNNLYLLGGNMMSNNAVNIKMTEIGAQQSEEFRLDNVDKRFYLGLMYKV